ncbi:MAG: undecaprenyl/decaprenyl-phosphate alpha-N-acetylglucosaminyl 1-phosphate transferase [Candidatus Omnitrophica bacterium]|nr:undecaprenyl/decaprenyl-phosphate alpha-N-acetylglucosaminyl 1-phosphate transferase [Candidatus Omnitrophota bacterium]
MTASHESYSNAERKNLDKLLAQRLKRQLIWDKIITGKLNLFFYLIPILILFFLLNYYVSTRYKHWIPQILEYSIPCLLSMLLVFFFTPIIIYIAKKFSIVDLTEKKEGFKIPIPLLGGTAIFLAVFITSLMNQPFSRQSLSILLGGAIIFIFGTIDDIKPISSTIRLFAQLIASLIVISAGLTVSFLPETWWGDFLTAGITFIWILGIVNALNFFDGADGLATGMSVIAAFFFFMITLHTEQFQVTLLAAIVIGVGLGFLIFNFKPAKIYLGDGGSTLFGFLLACLALYGGWSSRGPVVAFGIPVLILGVLIFDMIYITISRIRNGHVKTIRQWLDYRGNDHFHHRLINLGFKEHHAVLFIYTICVILGMSALAIENAKASFPVVILMLQAVLIFLNISILMLMGRKISRRSDLNI